MFVREAYGSKDLMGDFSAKGCGTTRARHTHHRPVFHRTRISFAAGKNRSGLAGGSF